MTEVTNQIDLRSYQPQAQHHRHDFHQLILPISGTMELETDSGNGRVSNAVAAFIPAGDLHSFSADAEARFFVLDIRPIDEAFFTGCVPGFFRVDPAVRGLLDYFRAEPTGKPHLHDAWKTLLFDRLAHPTEPKDRIDTALHRALTVMQSHLNAPINVDVIARAAGVSVSGLYRMMRRRMHTTPSACLAGMRLDEAERLLAEGRLSISQIALQTGFADQSARTRALRRDRLITPAAFQKLLSRMN